MAVRELTAALKYDPTSAESHYELGRILYEQRSYLSSIEHLERARSIAPGAIRVYHNLGLAYYAAGDDARAVSNFEEGLRLNALETRPSAWPLIDYATYFNLRGDFQKARDMLLAALKIDRTWDQAFEELSKACRGLGQTAEAIAALQEAVRLNPRKPEYHYTLSRLYTRVHDLDRASEQLAMYERQKKAEAR